MSASRTPLWRRHLGVVLAAATLAISLQAVDAAAPDPAAASHYCYVSWTYGPYGVSGPAIQGQAKSICTGQMYIAAMETMIQMKPCGGSDTWCQVAYSQAYCLNCSGSPVVTATSGLCAGTKQYRLVVRPAWSYGIYHYVYGNWYYGTPSTITC